MISTAAQSFIRQLWSLYLPPSSLACCQISQQTQPSTFEQSPPSTLPPTPPVSQAKYQSLQDVPITLHADLVRLAKLAKVGQTGLAEGVKNCCGGSANAFAPYISGLEDAINSAIVNVTAIAGAVVVPDAERDGFRTLTAGAAMKLAGRLLDNGGIKDCKVGRISGRQCSELQTFSSAAYTAIAWRGASCMNGHA